MKAPIIIILSVGVVIAGIVSLWPRGQSRLDFAFSSEEWKKADKRTRGHMVRSLMASRILQLKDEATVKKLLGDPDLGSTSKMEYFVDIGQKFGSSPWTYHFTLRLTNGIVSEVDLRD
jgi:hypothetical protein